MTKWCNLQGIDNEGYFCMANLAEGRVLNCPYNEEEAQKKCSDYIAINKEKKYFAELTIGDDNIKIVHTNNQIKISSIVIENNAVLETCVIALNEKEAKKKAAALFSGFFIGMGETLKDKYDK